MNHEGREEREVMKKKESRLLAPSFSLVNAYGAASVSAEQTIHPLDRGAWDSEPVGHGSTSD